MADNIKLEDIVEKDESTSEASEQAETVETTETAEQGPLKTELERIQKTGRTEVEKAAFSLKKNAERAKELGIDPAKVLGFDQKVETTEDNEDDKPITRGEWKRMQAENASKTALQSAEEIPNETERELVKYHLQNTIKSSGNPSEDLKIARSIVNSVKNSQITQEIARKIPPKQHSSASGVDPKQEQEIIFSPSELQLMGAPFNMTKQEIIDARKGKGFQFRK